MGLTVSNLEYTVFGNKSVVLCDVAFDASYPTGGEELLPGAVGLIVIEGVYAISKSGYVFEYDYTNKKLKAFYPSNTTPTGTNAASVVTPGNHATVDGVTVGTPALTHNADPVSNLAAAALYIVEAYGVGNKNVGVLQSNCAGTTSILGSTDDVSGSPGAATPRFFVTHNATPAGVAIYVDEADNDKLVFISPTATDAIIIMPFEAIAGGVPGYAYAVTVHHKASMSGCTPLYFDDNGAADAQLIFVDAGTSGGVIYASDIEVVAPQYTGITGNCGSAAAQVFSGVLAAGVGAEVGSTDDLSALTGVKVMIVGS